MASTKSTESRIPAFASVEEEAAFWDTHDTTDFEDEWEPVELDVSPTLGHILSIRVDREEYRRLGAAAKARGVGVVTLARLLVLEGLEGSKAGAQQTDRAPVE
jgi:hypothetical protein